MRSGSMLSTLNRWLLLAGVALAGVAILPTTADAQVVLPGDDDDKKTDDDDKRDRKDRKDRKDRDKSPTCSEGKVASEDTRGQCCWPGQVWNGDRCVGTPTSCPADLVADADKQACVAQPCEAAMILADDRHCCWPEQGWSIERNQCIGRPACPSGWVADGEDSCVRDQAEQDSDGDGIADADDACPATAEDLNGYIDTDGCPDAEELARNQMREEEPLERPVLPPDEPTDEGISGAGIAGWVLVGTGVALGGGGAALLFVAESERDAVLGAETSVLADGREVTTGISQSEAYDARDRADLYSTLGWVGVGVGGAALLTGVTLVLVDAVSEPTDAALADVDASGLHVSGGLSAEGPHVLFTWRH